MMTRFGWMMGVLALALAPLGRGVEESGFRVFTSKDGRMTEARLVEYDARKGRVKLERRGGKAVWVAPEVFCAEDRKFIKTWSAAALFLDKRNLSVALAKKTGKGSGGKPMNSLDSTPAARMKFGNSKSEMVHFEVELKNRARRWRSSAWSIGITSTARRAA